MDKWMARRIAKWQGNQATDLEEEEPVVVREVEATPGAPVPREVPPLDVYLDPDVDQGRKRIIIMLSEDGTIIEPWMMLGGISQLAAATIIRQVGRVMTDELFEITVAYEQQIARLQADNDLMHEKLAAFPTPHENPNPAPTMLRPAGNA